MSEERKDIDSRHPLLKDMSMDEILTAAERWQALTTGPQFPMMAPQGFTDAEQQKAPNRRSLTIQFLLADVPASAENEGVKAQRQDGVYKLTDMADLVRARALEERSA